MPGLQDDREQRELPQAHSQDGGRRADSPEPGDRPARGSAEDLRPRQEHLPHGHPSSPYHDDGTPKPPLIRLKNLELPLPGEEREPNGGAGRDIAAAWATTPRADDRAAVAEAAAWPGADPEAPVQEVGWEQDAAQESAQEQGSAQESAQEQDAAQESAWEQDAQESAQEQDAAQETPWSQSSLLHDQRTGQEDEPESHDQQPAPAPEADLDDDEPATQDQEAVVDDHAPVPIEHPQTGRTESLTPEQVRIAVRALGRCRLAEGRSVFGSYGESGLTPAMRRIEEQLDHGELVPETEKYALKSLDRFQEKLAKLIADEPDKSAEEHAVEIHDGVRYTFLFDHTSYVRDFGAASNKLEAEGFTLTVRKNTWNNDEYKGVNTRWIDPQSSLRFEIQFHTHKSWDAKQRSHDAYEKINNLETPASEKERLRDYQREISAEVPQPPRWQEITDYRREE